ncbi:MAG: hypothetical protein Q7S29_03560 [Candidatus Peribacter sp.]|nr:hypothetical protein [Candidatus Peribacter sp.]
MTECTPPNIGEVEPASDYHLTGGTKCTWNDQCRSGVCEPWWYFSQTQADSRCTCQTDAHCAAGQVCGVVNYRRACVAAPQSSRSSQGAASSALPPYRPPQNPPPPQQSSRSSAQASSWGILSSASSARSSAGMCTSDAECSGMICQNGQCISCVQTATGNTNQRLCPASSYCAADGRCVAKKPAGSACQDSAECLSFSCLGNYYDRDGVCGCSASAPCPGGQICSNLSECVAASSAQSSAVPRMPPAASSSSLAESCTARAARIYRETVEGAMSTYQQSMLQCLSSQAQRM